MPPARSRRAVLRVAGTALAPGLAGCAGLWAGPSSRRAADPEAVSGTRSSPVDAATGTATVVEYRDLGHEARATFRRLLEDGAVTGARRDFPRDLWRASLVRYRGTVYAVEREQTFQYVAEYTLETERTSEPTVADESTVVAFDELDPETRRAFEHAPTTTRERLPEQLYEYRYVRYRGDYYELVVVVADIPEWRLSVSEADR